MWFALGGGRIRGEGEEASWRLKCGRLEGEGEGKDASSRVGSSEEGEERGRRGGEELEESEMEMGKL